MSSSESNSKFLGRNFMSDKFFTIGSINLRPYTSYTNVSLDGRINDMDGFVHQIILYLALKYKFTFKYIPALDSAFGAFLNGSWNGLVGMLYRGEVDFIAAGLTVTYARSTVIGLTYPFDDDENALLIPYPELDITGNIDAVAKPFQYEIWILILISIVSIATVLWKIVSLEFIMFNNEKAPITETKKISWIHSFRSLFYFHYSINSTVPVRLLLYAWCILTIVLVNAYSSTLTSYLMTPRYHPMINSMEDIVNIKRPVFMVQKSSANEATILGANSGLLLKIGDTLRKYPELILNSKTAYVEVPELVAKHHKVFAAIKAALLGLMEKDLKDTGQCRLYLANKPWGIVSQAFALPKFSPIILIFNHEINWIRQVGLLDYWHRHYWPRPNRCSVPLKTNIQHKSNKKLTLNYLSSAFLLLGSGCAASFFTFILELIIARAERFLF